MNDATPYRSPADEGAVQVGDADVHGPHVGERVGGALLAGDRRRLQARLAQLAVHVRELLHRRRVESARGRR